MPDDETGPYVVRFTILRLESPALVSGAMYCISWRRGTYRGQTPTIGCDGGVVPFSSMPEAQAIVHFKPNISGAKGSGKFQNKYITLSIEENSRGKQNQVGLMEFDIANCLKGNETSCRVTKQADFRMAGFGATITIQIMLYPEGTTPPSANSQRATAASVINRPELPMTAAAITAKAVGAAAAMSTPTSSSSQPRGAPKTRKLSREECMTLLLSVEALMEQRGGANATQYSGEDDITLGRQVQELEAKIGEIRREMDAKRMLQAAAKRVVIAETETYVTSQFAALEATDAAAGYIADTTRYLEASYGKGRQPSANSSSSKKSDLEAQVAVAQRELKQMQSDVEQLSNIQARRDVSDELVRQLGRVHDKEQQIVQLQKAAAAATTSADLFGPSDASWEAERRSVMDEIDALDAKRNTLKQLADEGRRVYAVRVEDWANRKFAPMREYDRLQREVRQVEETERKQRKTDELSKHMADLFGELQSPAQAPVTPGPAPGIAPQQQAPVQQQVAAAAPQKDAFAALYDSMPKTADFGSSQLNRRDESEQQQRGGTSSSQPPPEPPLNIPTEYQFGNAPDVPRDTTQGSSAQHKDPFADLRGNFFNSATDTSSTTQSNRPAQAPQVAAPSRQEFNFGADTDAVPSAPPAVGLTVNMRSELRRTYAFGAEDTNTDDAGTSRGSSAGGAYAFQPQSAYEFGFSDAAPTTQDTRPIVIVNEGSPSGDSFWGSPPGASATRSALGGQTEAQRPPQLNADPSTAYSFGPASSEPHYERSNIFASSFTSSS